MGSGRGQSRRISTTQRDLGIGEYDVKIWDRFIFNRKLRGVNIADYYEIKLTNPHHYSPEEHTRIAQEIVGDLIQLGVVKVPDGFESSRFEVAIGKHYTHPGVQSSAIESLILRDREKNVEAFIHVFPHPHILSESHIGGWPVRDLVWPSREP